MKRINALALAIFPAPYRSDLLDGLSKKIDLTAFFERDSDYGRIDKFFRKSSFKVLNNKENLKDLKQCIKNIRNYDLILLYDYTSKLSRKLMRRAIRFKIPYCINCDGVILNKKRNVIADIVKRFYVRRASICFASGNYAKSYFTKLGANDNNIVIHHFSSLYSSDILKTPLSRNEKNEIRKQYNIKSDSIVYVGVGRFITIKNYMSLLKCHSAFPSNSTIILIGGGEEKENYNKYIEENNINNVVLLDFVEKKELLKILSCCDFFIHPTLYDAWGLVVNEAMSVGLPILSSNKCVAALELINNNGIVFDNDALRDAIAQSIHIFHDDKKYHNMCCESISTIKSYTINQMIKDQYEAIYKLTNN